MKNFMKDERGSFTLEATLVFPSLLIFTLIGVFFCIIIFQIGTASYSANKAASNLAYIWNNSQKDIDTGAFPASAYPRLGEADGLYCRITDNNILNLFDLAGFEQTNLVRKKLKKIEAYNGSITLTPKYNNQFVIYSEVEVVAKSSLYIPEFISKVVGSQIEVKASHAVTETTELIRIHNFAKYIWSEFGLDGAMGDAISSIKKFFGGG